MALPSTPYWDGEDVGAQGRQVTQAGDWLCQWRWSWAWHASKTHNGAFEKCKRRRLSCSHKLHFSRWKRGGKVMKRLSSAL